MHKGISLLLLGLTYALAMACNMGDFWWGYRPDSLQIAATAAYLTAWGFTVNRCGSNLKFLRFSAIAGGAGAAGAVFALLTRAGIDLMMIPALFLSGVFLTPLYGLQRIFQDTDLFYLTGGILSFLLFFIALRLKKRLRS